MSTAAINPKGPRVYAPGNTPYAWATTYLTSTVGQKVLVGFTGLLLVGFLVFHMIGNLKVLPGFDPVSDKAMQQAGAKAAEKYPDNPNARQQYVDEHVRAFEAREHLNKYAAFLKHDLGALIWIARGGLLLLFVLHLALALRLKLRSVAARPMPYQVYRPAQAGLASRTMVYTGVVVGLFTLFHLAHYTFGWVKPAVYGESVIAAVGPNDELREVPPRTAVPYLALRDRKDPRKHDVYEMTVSGFSNPWMIGIYLVAQVVLFVHLRHGIPSVFQTLGIKNARLRGGIDVLGLLIALTILVGNVALVVAVQLGWLKSQYAAG